MSLKGFDTKDVWRAIILYGLNTATYKIALGHCLARFAREGKSSVSMADLAEKFFDLYVQRLESAKPQLATPNRRTVMERVIDLYNAGILDRAEAIARVEREAFNDVIPRFHVVNHKILPVRFYEQTDGGLVLTDQVFEVFGDSGENQDLLGELGARWDLLEAAFEMRRENGRLDNDIRRFYLVRGHDRRSITWTRPILNGYQKGVCFYCGEPMGEGDVHVDHVIPRQFVNHDEIWNLVLAHDFCNGQKSDALPGAHYIEKLVIRNEYFINSNHPIKNQIIGQLGDTAEERRACIYRIYRDAQLVIRYTWEGIRGYDPENDLFYKNFIRAIYRIG